MSGKCPKCEMPVLSFNVHAVEGHVLVRTPLQLVSYQCPSCQTVLGVQADPLALKTDTVNALFKRLREER